MDNKECLHEIADMLDKAERIGADKDEPEGMRYIQLSDTLAKKISAKLRVVINAI